MRNKYPSKLLLFGEYLVLSGGAALAIPYHQYHSTWVDEGEDINELTSFYHHLNQLDEVRSYLDLDRMKEDLDSGWRLDTNIPMGSGLGSSASVVAAVMDRYGLSSLIHSTSTQVQALAQVMESYMHGKSSGVDILPIYYDCPITIQDRVVSLYPDSLSAIQHWQFDLIDTELTRNANQWISHFQHKLESEPSFSRGIHQLTSLNNRIIERVIASEGGRLSQDLHHFSELQFTLFRDWIPNSMADLWENELHSSGSIIKMLGAGGGGFFLKITY